MNSSLVQLTGELWSYKVVQYQCSMRDFKVRYTFTLAPDVLKNIVTMNP